MKMSATTPPSLTWHMCQIILDYFGIVVFACIFNYSKGHWLLNDALNSTISMSLKFKDEIDFATFDNLMEQDANVVFELSCLASNIKVEVVGILEFFFLL
jgi:hypothetical protein